jgi:hypothetical protein
MLSDQGPLHTLTKDGGIIHRVNFRLSVQKTRYYKAHVYQASGDWEERYVEIPEEPFVLKYLSNIKRRS